MLVVFLHGEAWLKAACCNPRVSAGTCCQEAVVNEVWPRAFPNLPRLLEERFSLVDPVDGYQADHHEYNRTRPATRRPV